MVIPAIISTINYVEHTCMVEVPDFRGAADTDPVILEAKILESPGLTGGYHAGDYVWIGLIRGLKGQPLVLGKLISTELSTENQAGQLTTEALIVANSAKLPLNTTFDGVDTNFNSIVKITNKLKEASNYLEVNKNLDFKLKEAIESAQIEIPENTYTNTQPLLQDLGGIKASNHPNGFDNIPITELLTELLYPYQLPKIISFSINDSGIHEKGTTININSATLVVQRTSKDLKEVVLKQNGTVIATIDNPLLEEGSYTIAFEINETLNGQNDVVYSVEVLDEADEIAQTSQKYTFVYPYFIGCLDNISNIVPADITSLNKNIKSKGTISQTYTTYNQYPIIAYPKAYGQLTAIIDQNGFTQTWCNSTIILELNGEQIEYYLYSGDISTTTASYKFNF